MRLFIDTNIFLDLILKRDNYQEALKILNSIEQKLFQATILDITILNIDYIAKKQTKDLRDFLFIINKLFEVKGATNIDIKKALELENSDIEDNLQYVVAKKSKCDLIVTNDKKFINKDIKLINSEEFCKNYLE